MPAITRSQKHADAVFGEVERYVGEEQNQQTLRRYKSLCKRAGGLLRTVGLIQFLAFVEAKGRRETYYAALIEHVRRELHGVAGLQCADSAGLLTQVRRQELPRYMQTTRQVLLLLQWHKRVAEILIEGNAEEGGD